jgi:hypothetical protein
MAHVFPIIRGESDIPSSTQRLFKNLAPLTDGNIVDAKPDFCYGARPEQLNPRIREELGSYIVPSTNQSAPILPNNSTEAKGPWVLGLWPIDRLFMLVRWVLVPCSIFNLTDSLNQSTITTRIRLRQLSMAACFRCTPQILINRLILGISLNTT